MKILHHRATSDHNGLEARSEGPYRIRDFVESVSDEELALIRPLAQRLILATHSAEHMDIVQAGCASYSKLAEVQLSPGSFEAMLVSVALAIMAARDQAFAVTRPPGHHAFKEYPEGFCFFNNVAIATNYLLEQGKRVAIIDIDGHHGNGTQALFKDDPRVFFSSIHQANQYPYGTGLATDIGTGLSHKKVVNIPVLKGSGDDVFIKAVGFIVEKMAAFNPDVVAVSAGFDGYTGDGLLKLKYSMEGFQDAGRLIASLGKPTFAVLEGGYHLQVMRCAEALIAGLSGKTLDTGEVHTVSSEECARFLNQKLETIAKLYA